MTWNEVAQLAPTEDPTFTGDVTIVEEGGTASCTLATRTNGSGKTELVATSGSQTKIIVTFD